MLLVDCFNSPLNTKLLFSIFAFLFTYVSWSKIWHFKRVQDFLTDIEIHLTPILPSQQIHIFFGENIQIGSGLHKKKISWSISFSKFYGKVGVKSWLLFHLIWKNYVLYWDFDSKSWIVDFFTRFTHEKRPQNNFSCQNFSVENNYLPITAL